MLTLSRTLCISKNELSLFFDQCLHSNFRIWLSEIRLNAAKKMMLECPDYSNDIISAECGFSCRTHLYRIFKNKEGCSPTEWRVSHSYQKGVAFIGMQHLFGRNATPEQGKATPFWDEKHYICTMKEMLETMPRIELALIIIGVSVLILGIILGYAMIHEYRMYLENHWKARYSFRDFIKRERFYIFLLLAFILISLTNLLYFLE